MLHDKITNLWHVTDLQIDDSVADLGGARDASPPLDQNFFIFMQFLGKIGQLVC